jgi:hypothetical protein
VPVLRPAAWRSRKGGAFMSTISRTETALSQESTLWDYLHDQYTLSKALQPQTIYQYEVSEVSDQLFNRFLQCLERGTIAPAIVRNRRSHLLSLWHAAYADGLAPVAARNIRKARVPWVPPAATSEYPPTFSAVVYMLQGRPAFAVVGPHEGN